jgi:hypothetical protein
MGKKLPIITLLPESYDEIVPGTSSRSDSRRSRNETFTPSYPP